MAKLYTMSDAHREDEADLSEGRELLRLKSVVCVPLISKSKMRGLIYVDTVTKRIPEDGE